MKIQLDKYYQNVNGVRLAPGNHDVQADLAAYLVANGHAVYVESELPQAVDETENVFEDLPEITEDVVTEERVSTSVNRNKKRK